MTRRRTPLGRIRPRRAFTLLEVVVALVLTSTLVIVSLRWVATLGELSALDGETQGQSRAATYAMSRLDKDFTEATGCDPARPDAVIAALDADSVSVYVDSTGDGVADLVEWEAVDGDGGWELRRSVQPADVAPTAAPCTFGTADEAKVLASPLDRTGGAPVFRPVADGAPVTLGAAVDCLGEGWDLCAWDAVEARIAVAGDDVASTVVEQVLPLR